MRIIPVALLLLIPSAVKASLASERMLAIAAQIGAPLPEAPVVAVPVAAVKAIPKAPSVEPLASAASGRGIISGQGHLFCSGDARHGGWMNGSIFLSGSIRVEGPDGAAGNVDVTGFASVSGFCRDRSGFVNGSGDVSGRGTLYKDGKSVGVANVSGMVFINDYASGGWVWSSQPVSVSGSFTPNN
jgi:hypothetical protein